MQLISKVFLLLLALFLAPYSHSQALNQNDIIHVKADSFTYNRTTATSIFLGPVQIDQGTNHIDAAKVITKQTDDKHIKEITAYGDATKPAHYWDTKKTKDPSLHAYANIIHYTPSNAMVTLKENAHIQQGNNHVNGSLIYYSILDQTVTAPKIPNSRTTIIYKPN